MGILQNILPRKKQVREDAKLDWVRWAVGFVVLFASASISLAMVESQRRFIFLLGFAVLPFVVVFLRWPILGIIATLVSGVIIPFAFIGGANATIALAFLIFGLWVMDVFVFQKEMRLATSRLLPPIYALSIISVLAFLMGQFPWFYYADSAPLDAQLAGLAIFLGSFLTFVVVANQVRELKHLKWITWSFIGVSSIYVIGLAFPVTKYFISTNLGSSGAVFWIWVVALAYSMALFNHELKLPWRAALMVVVAISVYMLFILRFSNKSGWVPILIVLWVITALRSWKLGGLGLLAAVVVVSLNMTRILGSESYSLSTRLEVLPIMFQIVMANPLFGVGFGNYYYYSQLFSIRGWYVSLNSHNNFVDIFVQTGFLGMISLIWFIAQYFLVLKAVYFRVQDGFSKGYVNALIGGLIGMILVGGLGDWVLPFVYNIGLYGFRASVIGWIFLAGLVVIERSVYPLPAKS